MTRDQLIEAMARAICWKNGMNPDLTLGGDGQNFLWHEYISQATAALTAIEAAGMRVVPVEPTTEMEVAGTETWLCEAAMEDRAAACWTAMLAAAQEDSTSE